MSLDSHMQLSGKTLGTCTLQTLLGRGGMGAVYIAIQQRPRRTVAVKVLLPELSQDTARYNEFLSRFRREADAIAMLDHVNIMPIYEYGEQDQLAYLVMPYVTGGTLRDVIARRGKLPLNEAIVIVEQIASALDYAHQHGIIHRDLKPGNILFHADGRLLLTDFGIAKVLGGVVDGTAPAMQTLTTTGTIIGTPEYLSPEQAAGTPIDKRADIYSLGVVLYQLLTGHVPFSGSTPVAVAIKHAMESPPPLKSFHVDVPPAVEQVIMKALAKQPEQRYETAGEFARALRNAASTGATLLASQTSLSAANTVIASDTIGEQSLKISGEQTVVAPESAGTGQPGSQATPPIVQIAAAPTVMMGQQAEMTGATSADKQAMSERRSPAMTSPHELATVAIISPPQQSRNRLPLWLALVSVVLVVVLVSGGIVLYLHQSPSSRSTGLSAGQSVSTTVPGTKATPKVTVQPTTAATAVPANLPPAATTYAGAVIYGDQQPICTAPQSPQLWTTNSAVQLTCNTDGSTLMTNSQSALQSIFLKNLPDGTPLPQNYVIQVQAELPSTGSGGFAIFFHTQVNPNPYNGYLFDIQPSGAWAGYSLDAGQETVLHSDQGIALSATSFTTIDVVVSGDQYMIFFNGHHYGGIQSNAYTGGTVGLGVDGNAQIILKNFVIYAYQG